MEGTLDFERLKEWIMLNINIVEYLYSLENSEKIFDIKFNEVTIQKIIGIDLYLSYMLKKETKIRDKKNMVVFNDFCKLPDDWKKERAEWRVELIDEPEIFEDDDDMYGSDDDGDVED